MELVTVDVAAPASKNERMTGEERTRIGRKLKAMRIERSLDQIPAAKKAGIHVGTLQAIEGAWYEVRDTNIEKYAQLFGTSVKKLLRLLDDKTLAPSHPLLKDLNEKHLEIARSYMRARRRVRTGIELLLSEHPAAEQLTTLLEKLQSLSTERLRELEALLSLPSEEPAVELLLRIWHRLVTDPTYAKLAKDGLDVMDRLPIPTESKSKKVRTSPKQSA
jgi:DNA-binding XRE family transcriptional regulator